MPDEVQEDCRKKIWEEQPYMDNVFPDGTSEVLEAFEVKNMQVVYFNQDHCLQRGRCYENCPAQAIARLG